MKNLIKMFVSVTDFTGVCSELLTEKNRKMTSELLICEIIKSVYSDNETAALVCELLQIFLLF